MQHVASSFAFWLLIAVGCAPSGATPRESPVAPAEDPNRARAQRMIAALAAADPETAERDFSVDLRSGLPPAVLASSWRSLLARYGALQSFRVVTNDHRFDKDRFSLELDFAEGSLLALIVFEPKNSQIIGLFFSARNAAVHRPPRPPPEDPRVEELALTIATNQGNALGASLTLPADRAGRLVPGIVLVPGSGPSDRDETLQRAKPFRDLAFTLAHHGVATLRFDERTYAYPESFDVKHSTVEEELLEDAVSAVRQISARPEVDPRRIFVVGHSLGGLLAPEIAERARGVAGLVLLAAPGRPLQDVMLEQMHRGGTAVADLAALDAKVHALSQLPATETLLGLPVHYFQDLARRDEMATAVRLHVSVLYLRGELDQNISTVDEENWARALTGRAPFAEATLPGLDHLFLPAGVDPSTDIHVPDDVGARIAAFTFQ